MKKGDNVVMIKNDGPRNPVVIANLGLTIGKIYKIQVVEELGLSVINDFGETIIYYQGRFKPLREHNLEKLNI